MEVEPLKVIVLCVYSCTVTHDVMLRLAFKCTRRRVDYRLVNARHAHGRGRTGRTFPALVLGRWVEIPNSNVMSVM